MCAHEQGATMQQWKHREKPSLIRSCSGEGMKPFLPAPIPYTSTTRLPSLILDLPTSVPLLFAHGVPALLQFPSPYRATCMKCVHSLRPNSNVTSSVPVLWLQTTLVWPLWQHLSWFPFLIIGCSLVCYSHEIKSPSFACPVHSLSPWPAQCRAQTLWEIGFIGKVVLLNEFTFNTMHSLNR